MKIIVLTIAVAFIGNFSYAQSPVKKPAFTGTKVLYGNREGNGVSAWSDVVTPQYAQFKKDSIYFVQDSLQRSVKKPSERKRSK